MRISWLDQEVSPYLRRYTHIQRVKHYSYDSFATFFSEIKCMIFPCPSIMIVAWRVFRHNNMFFNLLFDDKK